MSQSSPGGSETEKRKKDSQEEWLSLEDAEKGAKPGSAHDAFRSLLPCKVTVKCLMCSVLLVALILILSLVVALAVVASRRYTPCCPDSWVGYQQKCYYFSETEGNWDSSRSQCSALGASLAGIDSLQELAFLMRHKGPEIPWIGLRREGEVQPWKWANGTEFNKLKSQNHRYPVDSEVAVRRRRLALQQWMKNSAPILGSSVFARNWPTINQKDFKLF